VEKDGPENLVKHSFRVLHLPAKTQESVSTMKIMMGTLVRAAKDSSGIYARHRCLASKTRV